MLASITFSTAAVVTPARTASSACSAWSHSVSQHSLASAVPARVGIPPAIVVEYDAAVARASSQVARASPTPCARNDAGAAAMICESTSTRSGLRGKNRYSSNVPSAV